MEHIRSLSGTHFDPEVVEAFFQINVAINSSDILTASDDPAVAAS
jgi:response regulator RpfG family c-di-GMP phosphodiesterase